MSHLNHLGNQYSYNQGYADAREQAAQRLHDEIEALRLSVECPNLSDAMHAVVNNVLRGACQPGGIIHPELDDKRRAFIDSLTDDTAPQQYESLSAGCQVEVFNFADGRSVELPTLKKDPQ